MHTQWFWFRGLGGYPKGHRPSRVGDRWASRAPGIHSARAGGKSEPGETWPLVVRLSLVWYLHVGVACGTVGQGTHCGLAEVQWFEWAMGETYIWALGSDG